MYVCGMGLEPCLDHVARNITAKFNLRGGAGARGKGHILLQTVDQGQMQ